jgi:hypothetical protein
MNWQKYRISSVNYKTASHPTPHQKGEKSREGQHRPAPNSGQDSRSHGERSQITAVNGSSQAELSNGDTQGNKPNKE